jgi:hypothetical protein
MIAWFAAAQNAIWKFFASEGHFAKEVCIGKSDGSEVCLTGDQLAAIAAAGALTGGGIAGAPATPPASGDASTSSPTTAASLKVNGNNPSEWPLNQIWNDNLGALLAHDGQSETIYSTSTVDTTISGTSTIDYWAVIPPSQQVLHATRDVVVQGAANDNLPPLDTTGTDATSTAQ